MVSAILLVYVIPQFEDIFASFGAALQAFTQAVIDTSRWLRSNGLFVLFGMIAVISRVNTLIKQKGHEASENQRLLMQGFCEQTWREIRRNSRQIDSNMDQMRRDIAALAAQSNGYNFDFVR